MHKNIKLLEVFGLVLAVIPVSTVGKNVQTITIEESHPENNMQPFSSRYE